MKEMFKDKLYKADDSKFIFKLTYCELLPYSDVYQVRFVTTCGEYIISNLVSRSLCDEDKYRFALGILKEWGYGYNTPLWKVLNGEDV